MQNNNKRGDAVMTSASGSFDFTPLLAKGLPPAAAKWNGFPRYNFVGGNNDADQVPVDRLLAASAAVLTREGATLATYGLNSGPLGYRPLRDFLVGKLKRDAGITCTADEILITSGSLQGLDLVNGLLTSPGDTVLIEQECYQGSITRLVRRGVNIVGIPLDGDGMRVDAVASALRRAELLRLSEEYGVPIFEDDCYADLIWSGQRPPALYAISKAGGVIHIGSFSKSVAPALRVGYIVAPWEVLSRILPIKTDAGSGALEQMVLAEFCAAHFNDHVPKLARGLRAKLEAMMEALAEQFGTAAEFDDPPGGIFLWVKLPDNVDTMKLYQAALASGIAINPGTEWSVNAAHSKSRLRLCFASPSVQEIRDGVAALAEVCRKEFGVPSRSANVERKS